MGLRMNRTTSTASMGGQGQTEQVFDLVAAADYLEVVGDRLYVAVYGGRVYGFDIVRNTE